MFRTLASVLLVCGALHVQPLAQAETTPAQKAVLVTGARKDADLAELGAMKNIQAVKLYVTQQDQIDAAVKTIGQAGRGLYGLVNSAGVLVTSPLIEISEQGRISVIGSISGTLSEATWGPYAMTKFAMEAYADALSDEMKQFDVRVSLIEPGAYRSSIGKSALARIEKQDQSAASSQFKKQMNESIDWLNRFEKDHGDPAEVAEVVVKSLFDDHPKPRYLIVPNQEQAYWTINRAIERMVEQNNDQKFSYERAELIEMLDAALAKRAGKHPSPRAGQKAPVRQ